VSVGLYDTAEALAAGEYLDAGKTAAGTFFGVVAKKVKAPMKLFRGVTNKVVHKNSLGYVGNAHVYRIKGSDGTYKIGESAQGLRKRDGASIRAEQQVRKLQRETGEIYESRILKTFPNKKAAVEYQDNLRDRFRRMYGHDTLPGNREHLRGKKK
ncbi:hypothetical protein, partial [Vibrio cionasavignyae]|uniref:hypothetical protein n=1 Tax=Vibrio cionasavignyae TaxID=2910252 RepID=UPI003D12A440